MSTRPRDAQYLDDLARMLSDLDPVDRAEVLDSVREHIESSLADLGRPAEEEDVARVLAELGSPGAVAAEALAERPPRPVLVAPATTPALSRPWVPPVLCVVLVVSSLTLVMVVPVVVLLAAMVLMLASPLWTATQKLLGAVVAPLLLAVPVFGSVVAVRVEYDAAPAGPNWAAIGLIAMLLAGLVIEGLIWRSGARRAAELERQAATTQR